MKKTPQGGTEEAVSLSGTPAIDGATVSLTLENAVLSADTDVKVTYRKRTPGDGIRLKDEGGNEVASFVDQPVTNETGKPAVTGVALTSDAGNDSAYTLGETIRVTLTFSDEVAVTGTPRVQIDFSSGTGDERWADYASGSGTTMLEFAYEVVANDLSADGVAVLANTLALNGGTIRLEATSIDADLSHAALGHDPSHKVDWISKPAVTGVTLTSDAGDDDTYTLGETIRVTVTFSEEVAVTGTPRLKMAFNFGHEDERWAAYASGSGTKMLEFAYTVVAGDLSNYGFAVLANTLALNGGTIESASVAGVSAKLAHGGLARPWGRTAERVDARAPMPYAAVVDGATLTVIFNENLGAAAWLANGAFTVKKTPQGGSEQNVSLSGSPAIGGATVTLTLADAVLETDTDVEVSYAKPTSGTGNRLRDVAGNEVASFTAQAVNTDLTQPWLVRGEIDGATITLYFSEPLDPDSVGGYFDVHVNRGGGVLIWVIAKGDMEINGNVVTVELDRGDVQTKKGLPSNRVYYGYDAADDPAAKILQDLDGNPLRTWFQSGTWTRTRSVPLDNITGVARLSVADVRANEGTNAAAAFEVSLSRAAAGTVTVDYATADGTATAGADYTATSGTLTFAVGETAKTVSVPVLDDAVDEGEETFTLRLSNATGARIADGEATGTIANDDPLQTMWLSRFGRTVASHVTDAVSDRLAAPLSGAQVTVAGQRVDLAQAGDGAALTQALTAVARAFGASEQPAPGDAFGSGPPVPASGPAGLNGSGGWPGTAVGVRGSHALDSPTGRNLSGRELLLGSAFHLAREGDGTGPGLAAWGRVTFGGFDGEERADAGSVRIDGEVTTGILGADAEWNRLLAGVAVSVSEGEGTFDQPGVDSGTIESAMTAVSPYARLMLNDRLSVWGLAGWGTGDMTIVQAANEDTGQPERVSRADLEMRLAAVGGRGALLEADEAGGIDLGLRADAFWVETEAEAVSNEGGTTAAASRVRLALEGSRAFRMDGRRHPHAGAGARASP